MSKLLWVFTIRCEIKGRPDRMAVIDNIGEQLKKVPDIEKFEIVSEPYFRYE